MQTSNEVIVIGGGISGLMAAVRAQSSGLSVTVLEKGEDEAYLCNSRLTQGVIHCALADPLTPPEGLRARISEATDGEADSELTAALSEDLLRAIRYLQSVGVRFLKGPFHYQSFVLSPPSVTTLGRSWHGRGGDVTLRGLEARLRRDGGELRRGIRARELILEGRKVVGVRATRADGVEIELFASAVLICDGGAQAGLADLRTDIWPAPERIFQRNAGTGCGDGLRMAQAAGAAITPMRNFYGHLVSRDAFKIPALSVYPFFDYVMTSAILVNRAGLRVLDEGKGGIAAANFLARSSDPQDAFVIMDDRVWRERGAFRLMSPNPVLQDNGGTLYSAPTIDGLAKLAGIDPEALVRTVAQCNAALRAGATEGLTPPRSTAEGALEPIMEGPFHAVPVVPGITYTMGGIRIDGHSRVLDADGAVIEGLFAAGCTTGGLEGGGERGGYIGGLAKSVVTALRAAEWIAGKRFAAPPAPRGPRGELLLPFEMNRKRHA